MMQYLTPKEVTERYQGSISERTLANWRSRGEGPPFTKIGGKVLYPLQELRAWEAVRTIGARTEQDRERRVACR